jgi:hypothetical protein
MRGQIVNRTFVSALFLRVAGLILTSSGFALQYVVALTLIMNWGAAPPAFAQAGDVAVVVNPGNSATNLSLADVRKIFGGQKQSWPGGIPVKVFVRPPGSHERLALMKLLQMSESDYKQYWTAQVLRGEAVSEPMIVPSVGMQKEAIQAFPGGVTLVDAGDVKPGMKVLKIDGHLPGEPGYPLH